AALGFVTQITLVLWSVDLYSLHQSLTLTSGTFLLKGSNMTLSPEGIHLPGTRWSEDAVRLPNGAIDRRPVMVVQPTSPGEVAANVTCARANGLPIAVRGGGHDWAGRALADKGLVIDMSRMRR